jgi:hypothetical protein
LFPSYFTDIHYSHMEWTGSMSRTRLNPKNNFERFAPEVFGNSTLGTVSPQRRALNGLQIARVMHAISRTVISRPFTANPLNSMLPSVETLG